jgi:hypothetical protein
MKQRKASRRDAEPRSTRDHLIVADREHTEAHPPPTVAANAALYEPQTEAPQEKVIIFHDHRKELRHRLPLHGLIGSSHRHP